MTYETLLVDEPAPHVRRVTLSRPEAANALSAQLLDELADVVQEIDEDDEIRAWILTGAPRADGRPWFSAGVDLKEALAGPIARRSDPVRTVDRIDDLLTPSIVAIAGTCTTGALELALACDIRIAGESALLSDWHLKRTGLGIGLWGSAVRLSRLVGVDRAKEIVLLSQELTGAEAATIGLVNRCVPDDELEKTSVEMAATIASYPRRGVTTTLGFLQLQADMPKGDALRWAERTPSYMGVKLRPFGDAARRFAQERPTDPTLGGAEGH